jgi:hypothetical protein
MDNVSNIFGGELSQDYGDANFTIGRSPVYYEANGDFKLDSDSVTLFVQETGQKIATHGSGFTFNQPRRVVDVGRAIPIRAGVDLFGSKEQIKVSPDKKRMIYELSLPGYSFMGSDGSVVQLSLILLDSSDGSWPFTQTVAMYRMLCQNGCVDLDNTVMTYKHKHTKGLDIDFGARILVKGLEVATKEPEIWKDMMKASVTEFDAFMAFAEATGRRKFFEDRMKEADHHVKCQFPKAPHLLLSYQKKQNKDLNYLWDKWSKYSRELGMTQWAVYNTLTDWSTHAPAARASSQDNIMFIRRKREDIVRNTVNKLLKRAA